MRRFAFILFLLTAAVAQAQGAMTGVLAEDRAQQPLACVDVALIDSAGVALDRTQTAGDGGFRFASTSVTGRLSLRVSAHQLEPMEFPVSSVEADAAGARRYTLFLEPLAPGATVAAKSPQDSPPAPVRGFIAPKYPDELRPLAVRGSVVVGFAVDARGRAVIASVVALQSTHQAFLDSVREAVAAARFRPAQRDGRPACAFTVFSFQFDHARS